jgi:predicted DNA-binding transcriptional regulator YafY
VEVDAERVEGDLLVLDVRFGGLRHAVHAVWALGPDAEALSPPELREALATRAAATAARYTTGC